MLKMYRKQPLDPGMRIMKW